MKLSLLIVMFFFSIASVNAQIYKWVDEDGVTHFGQQPPAQKDTTKIKERKGNSVQSERRTTRSDSYDRSNTSRSSYDENKPVDCYLAVDNAKSSTKALRQALRDKYKAGEIDKQKYEKSVEKYERMKSTINLKSCEHAKGADKKFYSCMSQAGGDATSSVFCILSIMIRL